MRLQDTVVDTVFCILCEEYVTLHIIKYIEYFTKLFRVGIFKVKSKHLI